MMASKAYMVVQVTNMVGLKSKSPNQREALAKYEPEGPCAKRRLNLAEGLILLTINSKTENIMIKQNASRFRILLTFLVMHQFLDCLLSSTCTGPNLL